MKEVWYFACLQHGLASGALEATQTKAESVKERRMIRALLSGRRVSGIAAIMR
jgi:hypothetical protein